MDRPLGGQLSRRADVRSIGRSKHRGMAGRASDGIRTDTGQAYRRCAHGAGAAAFLAWLYRADILTRKKIANIILVPQHPDIFSDDAEHTFQRVRCPCRAALVVSEHGDVPRDWAQKQADTWNASLLVSPHSGSLNGMLGGWQWGMKLMQEMLLA